MNVVEIVVKAKDNTKDSLSGMKAGFEQAFAGLTKFAATAGADMAASLVGPIGVAAAGLAVEFAGAGAALGAFSLAIKPQAEAIGTVADAYDKLADTVPGTKEAAKATEEYNKALAKLPPATRDTAKSFIGLREDFKKWSDAMAPKTMPILTRGIEVLRGLIPKLTPLVTVAADALSDFMGSIEHGVKGGAVDGFVKTMARIAADTLPHLLNSMKNIGVGLGNLFMAFAPMTSGSLSQGIERVTQKFADWARSMRGNPAFEEFIRNSQDKLPGLIEMIGNLITSVMKITEALAPFSGLTLIVAESLAKLVASIPQETMDWLAPTIGGIVLAIKAWSVVQGILNVVLAANPISLVVIALAGLAAGLIYAYKHSETFRNVVNKAWTGVGEVVDDVWNNVIKKALDAMKKFFQGDIKGAIDEVSQSLAGLGEKAAEAADKILGIKTSGDDVKSGLQTVLDFLKEHWEPVLGLALAGPIGLAVGLIAENWGKISKEFSKHTRDLSGKWKRFWNGLVDTEEKIFNTITGLVMVGMRNVGTFLLRPFPSLNARWQRAWASTVKTVQQMNDRIVNFVRRLPGRIANAASGMWNGLTRGLSGAYNYIVGLLGSLMDFVSRVGNWIGSKISGALGGIPSFAHGGIVGAAGGGPRSNLVMVGEQGRELVRLPFGSTVMPHGQTEGLMAAAPFGGGAKLEVEWVGDSGGDEFMTWLRKNIRIRAGSGSNSVQTALGG